MSTKEQVREEIAVALNVFTAEGFAEGVGFDAGPAGITAEVYANDGAVAERYKVTFRIERIAEGAHETPAP